jgi:hypothetical protein
VTAAPTIDTTTIPSSTSSDDDEFDHYVCLECDPEGTIAYCGEDVSADPFVEDDEAIDCPMCIAIDEAMGCPRCGA